MANPFLYFNTSDDEDTKVNVVKTHEKPKQHTHAEKRAFKKEVEEKEKRAAEFTRAAPGNESLPEKTKESHKYGRMEKDKKQHHAKQGTSGHTHDRRSGTGRDDKPKKADKNYKEPEEKVVEEATEEVNVVEKEPEIVQLTLEEYYKEKGVNMTYQGSNKTTAKKEDIKADWIKKEKLTLITTKEDLRKQEKSAQPAAKTSAATVEETETVKVGFGSKGAAPKQTEGKNDKRGGKKGKSQFSAEDFPAL